MYLTFEEYKGMGGTVDENAFRRSEMRASALITRMTHGRILNESPVGHVEMVAKISGKTVTIYGHGSGTPRSTEMNAYCKSRYAKKTSTKLGHRGLIRVRRFIQDDVTTDTVAKNPTVTVSGPKIKITGGTVNVRSGPDTRFQILDVAKKGETYPAVNAEGWIPVDMGSMIGWVSTKYAVKEG